MCEHTLKMMDEQQNQVDDKIKAEIFKWVGNKIKKLREAQRNLLSVIISPEFPFLEECQCNPLV